MKKSFVMLMVVLIITACSKKEELVEVQSEEKNILSCEAEINSDNRAILRSFEAIEGVLTTSLVNNENAFTLEAYNQEGILKHTFVLCSKIGEPISSTTELLGKTYDVGSTFILSGDIKETCSESFLNSEGEEMYVFKITELAEKVCEVKYTIEEGTEFNLINEFRFVGYLTEDKSIVSPPCQSNEITIKFINVIFNKVYFLFEGMGPVNSFRGGYNLPSEGLIEMGMVNKSHIAGSTELTRFENHFFTNLFNAKSYTKEDNSIMFDIADSKDKLLFIKK